MRILRFVIAVLLYLFASTILLLDLPISYIRRFFFPRGEEVFYRDAMREAVTSCSVVGEPLPAGFKGLFSPSNRIMQEGKRLSFIDRIRIVYRKLLAFWTEGFTIGYLKRYERELNK